MKRVILCILFIIGYFQVFSQVEYLYSQKTKSNIINLNDTTFLRIVNGIVVSNQEVIKKFDRVSIKSKDFRADYLDYIDKKGIMIIGVEIPELQHEIEMILYSRFDFIKKYKFPLDIRLPISINNKIIYNNVKWKVLENIKIEEIKKIEYLSDEDSKVDRNKTPFGIINLEI